MEYEYGGGCKIKESNPALPMPQEIDGKFWHDRLDNVQFSGK